MHTVVDVRMWLQGISFDQFLDFGRLLRSISELDTALTFHTLAGAPIDQATFLHMARVVAGVELTPHVIEVVFTLFDENGTLPLVVVVCGILILGRLSRPPNGGFVAIYLYDSRDASPSMMGRFGAPS